MKPKKDKEGNQAKSKKVLRKKAAHRKAAPPKKAAPRKNAALKKSRPRVKRRGVATEAFRPEELGARLDAQAGDLQGLSSTAHADSESVDELLEEGNAFEAEVVKGVQDAPDADRGEITTHEVPEDDVPEEYLDKDE